MRILITGTGGLLGSNLALEAASAHTVFGVARSCPQKTEAFTPVVADLLDPGVMERILDETQPDWVIHCAAQANVDACEHDPENARELNTEMPRKLAQLVARGGARLLHVSTDAVFDGHKGEYSENDLPNPVNVYAKTKLDGEYAVLEEAPQAIVARINIFGWSPTGKRSLAEFFFNNFDAGNQMRGFTDVYFCPILVNDLAGIFFQMLEKGLSGLYHVVGSESINKYDFAVAIANRFGFDVDLITPMSVTQSGLKAVRSPQLTLKVDKLIHDLGIVPPGISPAIDRFYTLYQQGYPQTVQSLCIDS
ncbi:MAG: SDR family oxidoreductase [Anaerolineales bacterium]|nr:SDR family oxidoreductase [Chloroflexota bacterium]MBL6979873.1 SDR family oxidoreductase [Anaerolineales bacterium]